MRKHTNRGFTLIEVMVVVVIVGILAAIAYPSYQTYLQRTKRSDAMVALTEIANRQEKYYSSCSTYSGSAFAGNIGQCTGLGLANAFSPDGHYLLTVTATASDFTATADPNGAGTTGKQRNNGKLRIDAQGRKTWDKANNNSFTAKWTDK